MVDPRAAIVLLGGGEHARVVAEAIRSRPDLHELLGFIDPAPCEETVQRLSLRHLGDDSRLAEYPAAQMVVGVGQLRVSDVRERIVAKLSAQVAGWARIVHASAWLSPSAVVEPGAVVMAGAIVQTGARLGAHCIVNTAAVIEHDVEIGAFANIGPGARVGGGSTIGDSAMLGIGACVRDHVRVGSRAFVAMGAVVTQDVPDGAVVKGTPAR